MCGKRKGEEGKREEGRAREGWGKGRGERGEGDGKRTGKGMGKGGGTVGKGNKKGRGRGREGKEEGVVGREWGGKRVGFYFSEMLS